MSPIDSVREVRPGILYFRGALALLFAAFCVVAPALTLLALTFTVAAYLAADGVISLFLQAPRERPLRAWYWSVASGVAGIATGTLAFLFPMATTLALGILTGIWALSLGVFQVLGAIDAGGFANRGPRFVLGACGLFCLGLGMAILAQPWIGVVALLSLLAVSALVVGTGSLVLGVQLQRRRAAENAQAAALGTTAEELHRERREDRAA